MTACIPDERTYCFAPMSDEEGEPPQIRILVEGLAFAVPTALVCLNAEDGFALADRLNRKLGLERRGRFRAGRQAQPEARPRPRRLDRAGCPLPARRRGGQQHPALNPTLSARRRQSRSGRPGGGEELSHGEPASRFSGKGENSGV